VRLIILFSFFWFCCLSSSCEHSLSFLRQNDRLFSSHQYFNYFLSLSLSLSLSVFFRPHTSDNKKIDIYDGDVLLVQSPGDDEE